MTRIWALLLCLLPCGVFAYSQQGSHGQVMNRLETEVVSLKQGEVLIAGLYQGSGQTYGVDIQRVCANCGNSTEQQARDACTRNVKAVSGTNAKFFRYDFAAAQQVRTNIANRMRAQREAAERAELVRRLAATSVPARRTGRS